MALQIESDRRDEIRGLTLVELLISATLLALVLIAVASVGRSSERAYRTGSMASVLEDRAGQAIERVVAELRIAGVETLVPDPVAGLGADSVQFQQALDVVAGSVVWSAPRRLSFEYEVGELDDGLDNNGNGLIDEGVLVLTVDIGTPDERELVITRWVRETQDGEIQNGLDDDGDGLVDESGFHMERFGETLTIDLSLERRDAEGFVLNRSARTSTRLRN